jgi:hypothetical protein
MLNEHFLDYKETVYQQVTEQLAIVGNNKPATPDRPAIHAKASLG